MKTASVAEVTAKFTAYLKDTEGGPIVVTRNGRPVAVLIGVQDEDEIERILMAYSPKLRAVLDASRLQIQAGEGLEHEAIWAEVEASATPPTIEEPPPPRKRSPKKPKK